MQISKSLLIVVVALVLLPSVAAAQQLVYVVRHAERADGGAGTGQMATPADPLLSAAGEARAQKLAAMLADAGVKAIYTTEFRRTQDTAKPLAAKLGLSVRTISSRDTAALVAALKRDHTNDIVLVIGHSNTLPAIVKALAGTDVVVGDDDYHSLFVVSPSTGAVSRIRY